MKTRKNRLKGSVLFTVVSVMALLIIFLMSTLLLSTAASRRSHANYSESQAEYTARAAIESFAQAMNRNAAVAQSVINMSKNDTITPTVVINDAGMGSVGYYDSSNQWVDSKIQIEYVDDMYVYNATSKKWEAQQVLRVLATAKIGKEERTVAQYIRKKAPSEPKPVNIKGFQTLGSTAIPTGGTMTGAFCVGVNDEEGEFEVTASSNQIKWATELTFINGDYSAGTRLDIDVNSAGTGTVIMGDLTLANGLKVNLNYPYSYSSEGSWTSEELTQAKIPYFYVDGRLSFTQNTDVFVNNIADSTDKLRDGSPYNIFLGSADFSKSHFYFHSSDMYLMDSDSSITSYLGNQTYSANLYAWAQSIDNKTATQFYSEGGNVFCNHNLVLGNCEIDGDVRVNGNLTLDLVNMSGLKIHGDLVVKGDIIDSSNSNCKTSELPNQVDGTIYVGGNHSLTAGEVQKVKAGLTMVENAKVTNPVSDTLKPGYSKQENKKYMYVSHTNFYWDDGNMYYYYDFNGDGQADNWNPVGKVSEITDPFCYYPVDKDGNPIGNPTNESWRVTKEEYSYFDASGNTVEAKNAVVRHVADKDGNATSEETEAEFTYYVKNPDGSVTDSRTDQPVSYYKQNDDSSYTLLTGNDIYEASTTYKLIADYGKEIYPSNMTKEAIRGISDGGKYQIVTSLAQVRESLGYKEIPGAEGIGSYSLDSNTYKSDVPGGSYSTGTTYKSDFKQLDINGHGIYTINASDTEKKFVIKCSGQDGSTAIKINPNGKDIWVVLDDCKFSQPTTIVVGETGSVNFLIRGDVDFGNSGCIVPSSYYDVKTDNGAEVVGAVKTTFSVNENDSCNITYYGTNPSSFKAGNNKLFFGTALCPYTLLDWTTAGAYPAKVTYTTDTGQTDVYEGKAAWVGNCLFKETNTACNDFTLLYTGNAKSGSNDTIDNALLKESWAVMYYDVY